MNRRGLWMAGAGLCLAVCLSPAKGQYARKLEGLIDRPSAKSPSEFIGGNYTREGARPLGATRGVNVTLMGQTRLPSRASMRSYRFNQGLSYGQLGLQEDAEAAMRLSFFDVMSSATRNRDGELGLVSGLNRALSLNLPVPNVPIGGVPALSACAYTPCPPTTRFDDLLGLVPGDLKEAGPVVPGVAERLEARTSDVATWAEREGVALFKGGTQEMRDPQTGRYEKCPDCADKLARAVQRLRMAIDLDPQAALPSLLLAHLSLEQDRPLVASSELMAALRRDPNLLSGEGGSLDRYFGDAEGAGGRSAFLATQMRRYVRMGEYNPSWPVAHALEAYCAWRLGEVGSARAALARVDELAPSADEGEAEMLRNFSATLRAVLH